MLLCLSKAPDGLMKSRMANSEAGARIGGAGRQNKQEKPGRKKEQENKERRT